MGIFSRKDNNNTNQSTTNVVENTTQNSGGLINLQKEAKKIILEKNNNEELKAAVYLVLDYSGSMRSYYKNNTVQDFTEKILGIAVNLDDDGTVPTLLFDDHPREFQEVNAENHSGIINKLVSASGHMGTTDYTSAMKAVINHHQSNNPHQPALVIFQTDGSPDNRTTTQQVLCQAAELPIFWQFIGFGNNNFDFLQKLDDLEVPKYRIIDNADFFPAGAHPDKIPTSELYNKLLTEFPSWLKQAKAQGILKTQ